VGGYILDLYEEGRIDEDLCTVDIGIERSRREAPALWAQLERFSFERQKALIVETARFKSWGLAEKLCMDSEDFAPHDPRKAAELAELAVDIALSLDDWQPAEKHWLDELRALSWAELANARRVLGDLRKAGQASAEADGFWDPAFADVGDVNGFAARYFALKASLKRAERHLPEAFELLETALAADSPPVLKVRILINKAKTLEEDGNLEAAIAILSEARALAEETEIDPRSRLCLVQNQLDYLSKAERFMEAALAVEDVRRVGAELGGTIDEIRLRWTEARIAKGLGNAEEAVARYREVYESLGEEGLLFDSALISLELGLVHLDLRQPKETAECVSYALPILTSQSVEREALAAVALLTKAMEEEKLTRELLAQALEVFKRSKRDVIAS
jgi:tetratricopeptide (TPR) repeat protein